MALVNLDEARIDEVVWVWQTVLGDSDQAHIYQFGLRDHFFWTAKEHGLERMPDAMPLCGAPGYVRGSHNPLQMELRYNVDQCTWCLIWLVFYYPHLFTKGGT